MGKMSLDEFMVKMIEEIAQDVSYKFGDFVKSYPYPARAMVFGVVQSCITAQLATMPEAEKRTFDAVCKNTTITMLPHALDPRKFGGEKNGKG